jgi:hypothetical protein
VVAFGIYVVVVSFGIYVVVVSFGIYVVVVSFGIYVVVVVLTGVYEEYVGEEEVITGCAVGVGTESVILANSLLSEIRGFVFDTPVESNDGISLTVPVSLKLELLYD